MYILINSFFPLRNYYRKVLKTRFSFSVKYFFSLILFLSFILISTFILKNFIVNNNLSALETGLIKSLNHYPKNLIITIKNNQLRTNFNRPYIFWLNFNKIPHPILVIDERASKEKVYQFDSTTILVNSDGIIRRVDKKLRFYPFKFKKEIVINKQLVERLKISIQRFFKLFHLFLPLIFILLFIALVLFFSVTKIFYLTVFSFLGFLIVKILNVKVSYKKVFQISLHSNTAPLIFEFSILTLFPQAKFFYYYLLLSLVFFTTAIFETFTYQATSKSSHKPHRKKHPRSSHSKKQS